MTQPNSVSPLDLFTPDWPFIECLLREEAVFGTGAGQRAGQMWPLLS